MKVLYVRTSNIYNDSRATKEIMALLEQGHSVHILGWDRDGKSKKCCEEVFSKYTDLVQMDFFLCPIVGIGVKNIDKLLRWIWWTYQQLKKDKEVNVIHACNLDAAIGVWKYAKKRGVKIVYDIYDYYIDSHSIPSVLENFIAKLEINIINHADVTIICTEERKEQIAKATPQKVEVIHNSPDVPMLEKFQEEFDYAYCGSLFGQRLIGEIFDKYPENKSIKFAIAGYGSFTEKAEALNQEYENFNFFGSVAYQQVLKIESKSKVISAIYEPTKRNHRLCAPNKFYEALALAKPVIVCKGTGIDKIIKANNAGLVIDYDAVQFYEGLRTLISDSKLCEEMGRNARHLYETKYQWEIMKSKLVELYEEL